MIYFWKDGEFITNEFTNMMENVFRPPPLHVAKAKQLKQKKFNHSMLHVHDRQFTLLCVSCVEKGIEFCSDSRRVFGF